MPSERNVDDDMHDSRLNIIHTDQRTSSMNSFVDAHTPSESPEASSSESSTGGDWESGEFKHNELVVDHWPKQRTPSKNKHTKLANHKSSTIQTTNITTLTTTSTSSIPAKLSHQHQFKAKSNSIKIFNNTSNLITNNNNNNSQLSKLNLKKMRWLSSMSSDPDFRETFMKSVNIQRSNALMAKQQLMEQDYYSAICDTQLSVGSPYKSPDSINGEAFRLRARTNSTNRRRYISYAHKHHGSCGGASSSSSTSSSSGNGGRSGLDGDGDGEGNGNGNGNGTAGPTLVVARHSVERQAIGFNIIDRNSKSASGKPTIDGNAAAIHEMDCDVVDMNVMVGQKRLTANNAHESLKPKTNGHRNKSTANEQISMGVSTNQSTHCNSIRWTPATSTDIDCDVVDAKDPSSSNPLAGDCNASCSAAVSDCVENAPDAIPLAASACTLSLSSSSSSSSSTTVNNIKRRYPPFSFRDIRNEILSVMKSRNNPK